MIPVDAQIWTEPDVRRDGFSLETVLGEINNRGAGVKIALIDASRRNPFERRFRSFSAGLAPGDRAERNAGDVFGGAQFRHLGQWQRPQPVRAGAAQGNSRSRPDGRRDAQSDPRRRHPRIPQRAGALDFVLAGRGFFVYPGFGHATVKFVQPTRSVAGAGGRTSPASRARTPRRCHATIRRSAEVRHRLRSDKTVEQPNEALPPPSIADDPTIKDLTDKLADNPDDANAHYRRGQVYASKGAYSLAINDFDDSLRLNPKDVEAFNNRCWARTVIGDLQAALKDCNEALRLRPNFVDALDSRGLVNLKSGMAKNAIADFDAALKINPRLTSSLYGRGLAKQRNGSISEGELDISNAKAMDPNIVKEFASYGVH